MAKIGLCTICNKEFVKRKQIQQCCSKSCAMILRHKDPNFIIIYNKIKKTLNNPTVKEKKSLSFKNVIETTNFCEKMSIIAIECQNRPAIKEAKSKFQSEYQNRPEIKEFHKKCTTEYQNRPEVKKANSQFQTEYQNRPEVKKKHSDQLKKYYSIYANREKMSIIQKKAQNNPLTKLKKSLSHIKLWQNVEWVDAHYIKHGQYKEYMLPSGKIVKIQGYEPQVLTELLKIYSEDDIVIGVKEMNKEIGQIKYMFETIEHTYYPDFYIKSTNTIIEVKSTWTYEKWKEKNELKKQACLEQGFNFEFKILKNNGI